MNTTRFVACGECMLELTRAQEDLMRLDYAGDTYNVLYYLAHYAPEINAQYLTALGDDPYSDQMLKRWQNFNIDTSLVLRLQNELPGLHIVDNDDTGERRFFYYRNNAAVTKLFTTTNYDEIIKRLDSPDYFYFSSISVAILSEAQQHRFLNLLDTLRQNQTTIVFDTNYRPILWQSHDHAREVLTKFLQRVDIALPTFEDEQNLFGDHDPTACAARLHSYGVTEVVIKQDTQPCLLSINNQQHEFPIPKLIIPIDTAGAGDSFNGGYLSARLNGLTPEQSIPIGQRLAATVIQHRGAIVPRKLLPNLLE